MENWARYGGIGAELGGPGPMDIFRFIYTLVRTGGLTGDQQVSAEPAFHLYPPAFVAKSPKKFSLMGLLYTETYDFQGRFACFGRPVENPALIDHVGIVAKLAQMCKGVERERSVTKILGIVILRWIPPEI